jgi:2-polyprenyl-3-methyl-5-hydroxy-6-metoxy-1,4-benzoquinol methylase
MSYDYEASVWGRGTASLKISDPTSFRLKVSLSAFDGMPAGKSVLEIGCGAGQFIRAVHKNRPDLKCFGTDISKEALVIASKMNDGVTYSQQESARLPFADQTFAAVLIYDVLEHVEEPSKILSEAYRVLERGGVIYAFVPCEADRFSLWNLLRKFNLGKDLTKKHAGHINYFSRISLLKLFSENDLRIEKVKYSEHLLGQLLGIFAFFSMDRAARRTGGQINNETHFQNGKKNAIIRTLKAIVNSLVYIESELFSRVPSPNVHVIARKA